MGRVWLFGEVLRRWSTCGGRDLVCRSLRGYTQTAALQGALCREFKFVIIAGY